MSIEIENMNVIGYDFRYCLVLEIGDISKNSGDLLYSSKLRIILIVLF